MMGRSIAHGQQQEGPKACYSRGHHTHALPVLSTLAQKHAAAEGTTRTPCQCYPPSPTHPSVAIGVKGSVSIQACGAS